MSDLDARVAAPMEFVDAYADTQFRDEYETHDAEITQARDAAVTAIRAELQKPALHEPVTEGEVDAFFSVFQESGDGLRALESFLQGRAKPAQEEITDAECYRWIIDNDGKEACNPAIQSMWANCKTNYPSKQEWDTAIRAAIRASKGEKT